MDHNTQRQHFFNNPDRYDAETEELIGSLHRSRYRSIMHINVAVHAQ